MKKQKGKKSNVFVTMGASNHTVNQRQIHDYYATEPKAAKLLLSVESFSPNIWECACGAGHLSKVFKKAGYKVKSTDLINRGYGKSGIDFLKTITKWNGSIITNPPFTHGQEFVEKALELIPVGNKVAMFCRILFLESQGRYDLFTKQPPKCIYVSSARLLCAKNGDFKSLEESGGSAQGYAWYVWEKGFTGETRIKWLNHKIDLNHGLKRAA